MFMKRATHTRGRARPAGPLFLREKTSSRAVPEYKIVLFFLPVSLGKIWVGRSAPFRPTDRGSDRDQWVEQHWVGRSLQKNQADNEGCY